MDDILAQIKYFAEERIWKTKKTRMEAEARLKFNHMISNILINYYTFAVLAFSIWALFLNPNSETVRYVTLMTLITSVGLFGVTLLISTLGYRERSVQFKDSYIKLDILESEFKQLIRTAYKLQKEEVIDQFHKLEKKYFDVLTLSDNHDQVDVEKMTIDRKLPGFENLTDSYRRKKWFKRFVITLLFIFPLVLVFLVTRIQ